MEYYKNLSLEPIVYLCELDNVWKTEEWRDIPDYVGYYKSSDLGRVKSLYFGKEKILSQAVDKDGYLFVGLNKKSIRKIYKVHRLVGLSFIDNPENKPDINHKEDENRIVRKNDNRVWMIEWNTKSENSKHAFDIGLCAAIKGDKNKLSKLKEKEVLEIREIGKSLTQLEIGKIYGVSGNTIGDILIRKTWRHI